ncbi:MAG: hypothetical protein ACREO3_00660 [Arenimonas sp.]
MLLRPLLITLLASSPTFACQDTSLLGLTGSLSVKTCGISQPGCVYSGEALYKYMEAQPDDPDTFSIGLQTSPWRAYDGEMRILTMEEIAATVREHREPRNRKVILYGSWTGRSPSAGVESIATRLSKALDGFPVEGQDGFLWIDRTGKTRTTHQAFSVWHNTGAYAVPTGEEVMIALVEGWKVSRDDFPADDPAFMLQAAVGSDVFKLCPEEALARFEAAAAKGSAIAAYNAALVRLERKHSGDEKAAIAFMTRAAALGDAKARAWLESIRQ